MVCQWRYAHAGCKPGPVTETGPPTPTSGGAKTVSDFHWLRAPRKQFPDSSPPPYWAVHGSPTLTGLE
jgi:hypothetical protein